MPSVGSPTFFFQTGLPVTWSSATTFPSFWPSKILPSPMARPRMAGSSAGLSAFGA